MSIQIALAWSPECEEELKRMCFVKHEVYIKHVGSGGTTDEQKKAGDAEFFRMRHKPFQFVTTSWWGAGPD